MDYPIMFKVPLAARETSNAIAGVAVIAVSPEVGPYVTILANRFYDVRPTDDQLVELDQDLQREINEPYVLICSTPEFVESLKKDMPEEA